MILGCLKFDTARFIQSKHGNALLKDKFGFTYRATRYYENKRYWCCLRYDKHRCKARAVTENSLVLSLNGEHNHYIDD